MPDVTLTLSYDAARLAERLLLAEGNNQRATATADRRMVAMGVDSGDRMRAAEQAAAEAFAASDAVARAIVAAEDAEPDCGLCDDSGVVVEVEPVGDGTVSHAFSCVCAKGRAREVDERTRVAILAAVALGEEHEAREKYGHEVVDAVLIADGWQLGEPDAVELAEAREARAESGC